MKTIRIFSLVLMLLMTTTLICGCNVTSNQNQNADNVVTYQNIIANAVLQYPATNSILRYNVFSNCVTISEVLTHSSQVTIPETIENLPVVAIEPYAFANCETLKTVYMGSNLYSIGEGAFAGCVNLETVVMSTRLEFMGNKAFQDCTNLKSIVIPSTLVTIPSNAFHGCTSLISVTIEESNVANRVIEDNAFAKCESLKFVWLPQDIVSIKTSAFNYSLSQLTIYGYAASAAANYSAINLIDFVVLNKSSFTNMVSSNLSLLPSYPSIGKSIASATWQITLTGVDYKTKLGNIEAGEGNRFAIMYFDVTNISGQSAYFNGLFASCRVDGYTKPLKFAQNGELSKGFLAGTVMSDTTLRGYLICEVSDDFKYTTVDFSQLSGFQGLDATLAIYNSDNNI